MKFKGNNLSLRMAFPKKDAKVALLIPAAGNSSRMGKCKMLLPMPDGNLFLENILLNAGSFGFDKIILVIQQKHFTNVSNIIPDYLKSKTKIVINEFPEKERFVSIKLGLSELSEYDYCFIHNSDNPYLNTSTLSELFKYKNKADFVTPSYQGKGGHPILISKKIFDVIRSSKDNARLNEVLSPFNRQIVKIEDQNILTDIDSPSDYNKFIQIEKVTVEEHI